MSRQMKTLSPRNTLVKERKTDFIRRFREYLNRGGYQILVSHKCANRCAHCHLDAGPKKEQRMTPENGKTIVSRLLDGKKDRINVQELKFNGEPFAELDLVVGLIEFLRRREREIGAKEQLTVSAISSGFWGEDPYIARKLVERLKKAGLNKLSITWDMFHESSVRMDTAVMAANIAEDVLGEGNVVPHILKDLSGNNGHLVVPIGRGKNEVMRRYWDKEMVCSSSKIEYVQNGDGSYSAQTHKSYLGQSSKFIDERGDVYADSWLAYSMGNILEKSLSDIFRDAAENQEFIEMVSAGPLGVAQIRGKEKWFARRMEEMGACGACYELFRSDADTV